MKKLTSVDEIKVGATIKVVDVEFEVERDIVVESVEEAPGYGRTSVYVNDEYRVDVFEQDVFEL